ncbi:DNA repair and recombination protein RadA [Halolamina salina]|uniref:DNA repair and recombination protein RadA n=1 Tax=Halolamina salina TaxID=1220023 RepID=A0ABD6BA27_9EURY
MSSDDLQDLPKVGPSRETDLKEAGFETMQFLAVSSPGELSSIIDVGESTASDIINGAREAADIGGFDSGAAVLDRPSIKKLETGHSGVDRLLGGGIETQAITEFYGNENSGRTTMAHQLCVQSLLPDNAGGLGGDSAYIDTRGKFDPDRVTEIIEGLDTDRREALGARFEIPPGDVEDLAEKALNHIHIERPTTTNEQLLTTEELSNLADRVESAGSELRLVIVDSLTINFRAEYQGRGELAERQQKLNSYLHDLRRFGDMKNAAVVVTNATNSSGESYGGAIVDHSVPFRLQIQKTSGEKRRIKLVDAPNLKHGEVGAYIEQGQFIPE